MATGGRKTHLQVVHTIGQNFTSATPASGVLGVLPAGAVLLSAHLSAQVAFNSTTNTLALGTTVGGTQLLSATDLKTVARTDTPIVIAQQGALAADTPVYWTLGATGGAATLGAATAFIDYMIPG
jgi:hypothetical protein